MSNDGVGNPARSEGVTAMRMSIRRRIADEQGAMAVVVAILILFAFFALAAIVVDAGVLYTAKRQLRTAADAGALAGVRSLPGNRVAAEASARDYVARNTRVPISSVQVTFGGSDPSKPTSITAWVTGNAPAGFAKSWGVMQSVVRARATAQVGSPTAYGSGVMPFGIMASGTVVPPYGLSGADQVLKTDPSGAFTGNFHLVALDKNAKDANGNPYGWSDKNNVNQVITAGGTNVPSNPMTIGQQVKSEPGNVKSSLDTLSDYLNAYCQHTYSNLMASYDSAAGLYTLKDSDGQLCRRIVTCPVIVVGTPSDPGYPSYGWSSVGGSTWLTIVGFAQYFVQYPDGVDKNNGIITGKFVQVVDPDAMGSVGTIIDWAGVRYWLAQ